MKSKPKVLQTVGDVEDDDDDGGANAARKLEQGEHHNRQRGITAPPHIAGTCHSPLHVSSRLRYCVGG